MKYKFVLTALLGMALVACNHESDTERYIGYWKKMNYPYVVLEIEQVGSGQMIASRTNLKELKRTARKEPGIMKDGVLMLSGKVPVPISEDGSLLYLGDTFVRQDASDIEQMKRALDTPQKQVNSFAQKQP